MQRWEYRVRDTSFGPDVTPGELGNWLDKLGAEGWELVGFARPVDATRGKAPTTRYVFKRPLDPFAPNAPAPEGTPQA